MNSMNDNNDLKFEELQKIYSDLYDFCVKKNFEEEFKKLVDSRPMLSIEKRSEYVWIIRELIFEFLKENNRLVVTPMILGFVINFCMDTYPRLEETLKECYR